jgi:uncharacterized membrane protein YdjX (TVP38/TMEM64 family)
MVPSGRRNVRSTGRPESWLKFTGTRTTVQQQDPTATMRMLKQGTGTTCCGASLLFQHGDNMRDLLRPLLVIVFVLLVPILPFLLLGEPFEAWTEYWQDNPPNDWVFAGLAIGLLASDILLPVPSSVVNTFAGSQLGAPLGTLTCWTGMTLGAILGFALARYGGRPIAERLSEPDQLQQMEHFSFRYGPGILVLFRAVPVLAEASVLLVGLHGLSWRRFLLPVLLSNLGIALAYAGFGQYAAERQWLPLALGIAVALPLLLTVVVQGWLTTRHRV